MLKDWHTKDPLGELFKLVGAFDYMPGMWQVPEVRGMVITGVSTKPRQDLKDAWMAVRMGVSKQKSLRLVENGHANLDQFRAKDSRSVVLQKRINPAEVSAIQLVEQAKDLVKQATQLTTISKAHDVIDNVSDILDKNDAALDLLPEPSAGVLARWDADGGWLTEGDGSLTAASWDKVSSSMRRGTQDGIRLERCGSAVRVAVAQEAASYLIEDSFPKIQTRSILELATRHFSHELRMGLLKTLDIVENHGQRRLFHVVHTLAHGTTVYVFDAWSRQLIRHDQMTDLFREVIRNPASTASSRLRQVAAIYHFQCRNGVLGNSPR